LVSQCAVGSWLNESAVIATWAIGMLEKKREIADKTSVAT